MQIHLRGTVTQGTTKTNENEKWVDMIVVICTISSFNNEMEGC